MIEEKTDNIPELKDNDKAIVKGVSEGKTLSKIADDLKLPTGTIGYRLFVLRTRYRCNNTAALVSHFIKNQLID